MIGMHGSFKSDKSTLELSVIRTNEDLLRVGISTPGVETFGCIDLPSSNAPTLALAILEAAGHRPVAYDPERLAGDDLLAYIAHRLAVHVGDEAKRTAAAKAQAELEAEALELYKTYWSGNVTGFSNEPNRDDWINVARRAREMRAEK